MNSFISSYKSLIVGIVLAFMIFELIRSKRRPATVFGIVVGIFLLLGYISVDSILKALITKSVLIIFIVIAISSIINEYFDIGKFLDRIMGKIRSKFVFLTVLCACVALISSVFNNTPVVIILIPYVMKKGEYYGISPSKLLIPLSFSAILGGMITLIGTSTNLVLNGLLESNGLELFKLYDFVVPGLIVTGIGIIYFLVIGFKLLPSRSLTPLQKRNAVRKYFVEAKVGSSSTLVGKSIEDSGIKDFRGISLIEIVRGNKIFKVVASKNLIVEGGDRLIFSGSLEDVMLINEEDNNIEFISTKLNKYEDKLEYVELSIPTNSWLDGKKIKDTDFRTKYSATILAVHRNGEDLSGRIGEIKLRSGDLLIVVPHSNLSESIRSDFYILSNLKTKGKQSNHKVKFLCGLSLLGLTMFFERIDLFLFLFLTLILLLSLGYTSINSIKSGFRVDLFVVLCASIIIGEVFISSGLADFISGKLLFMLQPYGMLVIILGLMLFTILLTSFITNVAAVSIAFPLAYSISLTTGIPGEALYLVVAFGASAAFMTPIGYQTNLIILAPGDYRFKDFFKVGAPLTVLYVIGVIGYIMIKYKIN